MPYVRRVLFNTFGAQFAASQSHASLRGSSSMLQDSLWHCVETLPASIHSVSLLLNIVHLCVLESLFRGDVGLGRCADKHRWHTFPLAGCSISPQAATSLRACRDEPPARMVAGRRARGWVARLALPQFNHNLHGAERTLQSARERERERKQMRYQRGDTRGSQHTPEAPEAETATGRRVI